MLKRILSLLFLLSINTLYASELDIYGYKFPVDSIEYLDGGIVNLKVGTKGSVIIKSDDLNFYMLESSVNSLSFDEFAKLCDEECLIEIFKKSFNNNEYNVAAFSYLVFIAILDDTNLIDKQKSFLNEHKEGKVKKFYENLFTIRLPQKIKTNERVNKFLSESLVNLALMDSSWVVTNAMDFLLKNENDIASEFNKLISESDERDNSLEFIEQVVKVQGELLGFSNLSYQRNRSDLTIGKQAINEIQNINSINDLYNVPLGIYEDSSLYKIILQEYIDKLYKLVDESLTNGMYKEVFNSLFLVPETKVSETMYQKLSVIFDSAPRDLNLLNDISLNKLQVILKNNNWLKQKVINYQEGYLKNLINRYSDESDVLTAFNILTKLRPDISIGNDKIRVLIAWYALVNNNKNLSNQVISGIHNNIVFLFSFKGLFLFCKKFLWIFFAFFTTALFVFIFSIKYKNQLHEKISNSQRKRAKKRDPENLQLTAERKAYLELLKYFNLPQSVDNLNEIKSVYRKKIKKIHPDILGKETKEFLEVQEKYKKLLKLFNKIYK